MSHAHLGRTAVGVIVRAREGESDTDGIVMRENRSCCEDLLPNVAYPPGTCE